MTENPGTIVRAIGCCTRTKKVDAHRAELRRAVRIMAIRENVLGSTVCAFLDRDRNASSNEAQLFAQRDFLVLTNIL